MTEIKLRIHRWPDEILKKKSRKVERVDSSIKSILDQMYVLMKASDGAGLASNQAGLDIRLIVVEAEGQVFRLVNPEITAREGTMDSKEGCLSFPGIELTLKRSQKIEVNALDQNGLPQNLKLEGLLAIVFQHEIDHINGVTFIDRASFWQRLRLRGKLKKLEREVRNGLPK